MQVSRICLGTMSFGNQDEWMVEIEKARPIMKRALDLGINPPNLHRTIHQAPCHFTLSTFDWIIRAALTITLGILAVLAPHSKRRADAVE